MPGIFHEFVAGLSAEAETRYQIVGGDNTQPLHLPQSTEAWCGPWSLLQAVLLICGWRRSTVTDIRTRSEPMRSFWRLVNELYADGTSEADLAELAALLAPAIELQVVETASPRRVARLVAEAVDSGQVPLVRYTTARFSHWSMASGVERTASGTVRALLLLDTSLAGPWAVPYNTRLELQCRPGSGARYPLLARSIDGGLWRTRLNSVCIVKRGTANGGLR